MLISDALLSLSAAGRSGPRPTVVEVCSQCDADLGENYAICHACTNAIERYWHADWEALLAQERVAPASEDERLLAAIVVAEIESQPWTLVDYAMTLLRCSECGCELGGGSVACGECEMAFGNLWWHDQVAGRQGVMTMNEHALRVGRHILRHRHRYSKAIVTGWSLTMPRLLTGWLPTTVEAQRGTALINQGRVDEARAAFTVTDAQIR